MRASMLAAAVILASAVAATPAAAEDYHHHGSSSGLGVFRDAPSGFGVVIHRSGGGHHGGGSGDVFIGDTGGYYYGGEWALYNNRTFEKDSYNDWWHDNPERAFPRWVTNGQCARQWYAADTLRC
ncbi:MAG TPA: hypothetical protein VL371_09915 [Gemmataceae bacterium]|nr:hypothetical protein [Gemmataceae bacterium]